MTARVTYVHIYIDVDASIVKEYFARFPSLLTFTLRYLLDGALGVQMHISLESLVLVPSYTATLLQSC